MFLTLVMLPELRFQMKMLLELRFQMKMLQTMKPET